jgi:hypothetical protein
VRHSLGNSESGRVMVFPEEKTMSKTTDTAELSLDELNPGELNLDQLEAVSGGLLATMLSNIANMRHEMLKTVANNLRA